MPLKTFIKVSEVTNLHDARYCAGMGVDLIGFRINPALESFVKPETFKEITAWLEGIQTVGELGDFAPAISPDEYSVDYLQTSNADLIFELSYHHKPLILRQTIDGPDDYAPLLEKCQKFADKVDFFLLESYREDITEEELPLLKELCSKYKVLLGFGVTGINVDQVLADVQPYGLSLKGSEEIKVGYNDFDELASILEALEIDD